DARKHRSQRHEGGAKQPRSAGDIGRDSPAGREVLLDEGIELLRQEVEWHTELAKRIEHDEIVKSPMAREVDPAIALDNAQTVRRAQPEILGGHRDDA